MPVNEVVSLDKGLDVWANFGTKYVLERREIGIFNLGGSGKIVADGAAFASGDASNPARFYMVSAPPHRAYEIKRIIIEEAAKRPLGTLETCNKRVINQFIHPSVLKTCQLILFSN